ncbi:gamma-glutamyltranspeptidase [Neoconidiobolus thromboides FSU 785]|nr:gamma-glutamyltranspeptidase [Neoconidiobolus thromboides FSU 785]
MVSSSQPLATQAGLEILKSGGNAADAAVATAAALNVTEPCSTGIGGDAFCLFYSAKDKKVYALNGSGRSPKALTLEKVHEDLGNKVEAIPRNSPHSITVPGACAAMVDTVNNYGSGKLNLGQIFKPAIELAENGYPVSEITSEGWKSSEKFLKQTSPNWDEMLIDGKAPEVGQIVSLPNLAKTYRKVAEHGKDGFYKGEIANKIVELIQSQGGVMTLEDLASHQSEQVEPIHYDYKGIKLYECPPNGQGITALIALGIIDELEKQNKIHELNKMEPNSPEYLHILIEALRIAFADTRHHVTDPDFYKLPASSLLSKEYLYKRCRLFNPTKAAVDIKEGSPINQSNTVYLTVVDKEGNACSFIMSNFAGFGSGKIPKGCGFTLQNRGTSFSLNPKSPNKLEANKRPYHTIIPALATKGEELWLSFGVMGGFMQPQGHLQVLLNLILRQFKPQKALDFSRFCISPDDGIIYIEAGVSLETVNKLKELGHKVIILYGYPRKMFGRGQIIQVEKDQKTGKRVLMAGSDPRADGQAAGF